MGQELQVSEVAQGPPIKGGEVDAFISYKRADFVFADRLCNDLEARGKQVWLDRTDIGPAEEWQSRIRRGIEAAKAFVFVVTPESVASTECLRELSAAEAHHKRIVPVIREDTARDEIPRSVGELNWIFARTEDEYRRALDEITDALEADVEWRDQHSRLAVRSREWLESARDRSYLLRGRDLRTAEDWFAEKDRHKEQPTDAQFRYLIESRRGSSRRQRTTLVAVSAALAISLALAGFSLVQRNQAIKESQVAVAQSRIAESDYLAAEATNLFSTDVPVAMQLSIEAYQNAPTSQAKTALLEAAQQPLEKTLRAPDNTRIETVAFDPDGQTVASGDRGGEVVLWNVKTLSPKQTLFIGTAVESVVFSTDGSVLAAGLDGGDVVFWDTVSGSKSDAVSIGTKAVGGLAFSPDGATLAVAEDDSVVMYDVETGVQTVLPVPSKTTVWCVAFTIDGTALIAGDDDGNIVRWNASTLEITASMHDPAGPVHSLAFSPDGTKFVSADPAGYVILWDVASNTEINAFSQLSGAADVVAFSPNDQSVAAGTGDGDTNVLNVLSGVTTTRYPFAQGGAVTALAFSPDAQILAAGDQEGNMTLWGAFSGNLATSLLVPTGLPVDGLAFDPSGETLASGDGGGDVILWDGTSGKRLGILPNADRSGVAPIAFGHAGDTVAATDGDGVTLWQTKSPTHHSTVPTSDAVSLAFSPDGTALAVGGRFGDILVWNLTKDTYSTAFQVPGGFTTSALAYSPDSKSLAIGDAAGDVLLWNPDSKVVEATLHAPDGRGIYALAYSRDGRMLASADGGGQVVLWDTTSDRRTAILSVPDDRVINSLSLSPDGRTLASGDVGGDVILWTLSTDAIAAEFAQPDGHPVDVVAFSPDGRTLASADANGVVFERMQSFWTSSFQTLRGEICLRVGASLSRAQWNALVPNLGYSTICPGRAHGSA